MGIGLSNLTICLEIPWARKTIIIESPALARISQFLLLLLLNQAIVLCTSSEGTTYSQFWAPCRRWYSSRLLVRTTASPPKQIPVISCLSRLSKYFLRFLCKSIIHLADRELKPFQRIAQIRRSHPWRLHGRRRWLSADASCLGISRHEKAAGYTNIWRSSLVRCLVLYTGAFVCVVPILEQMICPLHKDIR